VDVRGALLDLGGQFLGAAVLPRLEQCPQQEAPR
jgi:hypothetical protein